MSDNWLSYTPSDPCYRPTRQGAELAKKLLDAVFPNSEGVTIEYFDSFQFADPMCNWSGVNCSACGLDAEPWWDDAVNAASDRGSLVVETPCCHKAISLNDLDYVWPAAFGHFILEVMNPDDVGLDASRLHELEQTLGCKVKEVARQF